MQLSMFNVYNNGYIVVTSYVFNVCFSQDPGIWE